MASTRLFLSWIDYCMLIAFLSLSAAIGIWHGCFGNKQSSTKDFLMAGGKMNMIPTAFSLFATLCSASTLLGIPVEIYYYSTMYLYFAFSWVISSFISGHVFIPKMRQLGSISIYAYLEKRFSLALRISVTLTFIISVISFMSVILYGPSLALNQVTGLDLWLAIISCGLICTFYTSIGGMKAVIWTDVVQTIVMFLGVMLSIIFGFADAGGVKKVLDIAYANQRINLIDISFDPTIRYTLWSTLIGGTFYATVCSCALQTQTQRYMCVKNTQEAQKAVWLNNILIFILLLLCGTVGLLIYVKYHQCDPQRAKLVSRSDQLYPLFIMEIFDRLPGLTGLFIASVLSGSLSSISSGVNSIAAVIMEDIWKRLLPNRLLSDQLQTKISKYLSVVLGLITIVFAFAMSYLPSMLVIVYSVMGTLAAPIFAVFILGFFFPRVNNKSASIAFFLGLSFQLWILIGATLTGRQQVRRTLPTSIDGCASRNVTVMASITNQTNPINSNNNVLLPLYSISFMWYGFNGVVVTILIALFCSLFCKNSQSKINRIDSSLLISWEDISNEWFCCKKSKSEEESHHLQNVMKVDGSSEEKEPMPVSPSNNSVS